MTPPWQGVDEALFRQIHLVWRHPEFDGIFRGLSDPGRLLLPALLVLIGFLWMQRKRGVLALLILAATIAVSDQTSAKLLKPIFKRQRPSVVVADSRPFFGVRGSYSFPSVHATNSFAAAMVLDAVFPGARPALFTLAALVGYSRVYVGDHWPSDVLAGMLLGSLIGWGGRTLFARLSKRFAGVRRAEGTPNGGP
ncbi:MAG TPA: phosphatase PAP2 family protein [Candidatus Eisenbacteria bacterium]|nr:phosphatase PAP2 family protein [Candidatus Eisenbacteria bacterium]